MDDEERCEHCKFFRCEDMEQMGECHRYPAATFDDDDGHLFSAFAPMPPHEWCGEFKRRCN